METKTLFNKKLWIARDEAVFEDSNEREYILDYKQDCELLYGELNIFYDKPELGRDNNGNNVWINARKIATIPSYMFPEIKCEQCAAFVPKEIID